MIKIKQGIAMAIENPESVLELNGLKGLLRGGLQARDSSDLWIY